MIQKYTLMLILTTLFTQDTEPMGDIINEKQDKCKIEPEMHSELPLAVRQLLDITEETIEKVNDWSPDASKANTNTLIDDVNIVTKTPVAVQQHDYPEAEVIFAFKSFLTMHGFN